MYNDNTLRAAPATISFDTSTQNTPQRSEITLPRVSSFHIPGYKSLLMSGRTYSLEADSPSQTRNARSPRRYHSFLNPGIKVKTSSIHSFRSRKSVASSVPHSHSIRKSPSPKPIRGLGKFGVAAIIGRLKSLNFKRLTLSRKGVKDHVKQKGKMGVQSYDGDMDMDSARKGLLERPTENMAFDIDADMDSRPLSAGSYAGDMEMDMDTSQMRIDSPTTQFAAYRESDPFATPHPSATMSVDSGMSSPLSSIMNNIPGLRNKISQEAALRSRLKTLQILGPEASCCYCDDKGPK